MINKLLEIGIEEKDIIENASMKKYTTLKIGGEANCIVKIKNIEQLKRVVKLANDLNKEIFVMGNGSNLLVRDKHLDKIVLKIEIDGIDLKIVEDKIEVTVGAGVKLGMLGQKLAKEEIAGFEELTGIPGTIGGAIRMNAGAHKREIKDVVTKVYCIDYYGNEKIFSNSEMDFGYRKSILKKEQYIVYKVEMGFSKGSKEGIEEKLQEYMEYRKKCQPIGVPNAGSTFKRGEDFITAKLIDDAGLKGKSVGGISVSEIHAGFLVNNGDGTAEEMLELIEHIKEEVELKFGKKIELEIEVIGE